METLTQLFHRHVAASFDKQFRMGDAIGDFGWQFHEFRKATVA